MGLPSPSCETKFSGANRDREVYQYIFRVQLNTSRIDNLTRIDPFTLARCDDHICTRGYNKRAVGKPQNLRQIRPENARQHGGVMTR